MCSDSSYPLVHLSLEFQCDYNSTSKRHLCEDFWKLIEQNQQLGRIMAKGCQGWNGKSSQIFDDNKIF